MLDDAQMMIEVGTGWTGSPTTTVLYELVADYRLTTSNSKDVRVIHGKNLDIL